MLYEEKYLTYNMYKFFDEPLRSHRILAVIMYVFIQEYSGTAMTEADNKRKIYHLTGFFFKKERNFT